MLVGWRPSLLGRSSLVIRLEASRLEAIASRLEVIASRLEAIASRLEVIASRLEALAVRLDQGLALNVDGPHMSLPLRPFQSGFGTILLFLREAVWLG